MENEGFLTKMLAFDFNGQVNVTVSFDDSDEETDRITIKKEVESDFPETIKKEYTDTGPDLKWGCEVKAKSEHSETKKESVPSTRDTLVNDNTTSDTIVKKKLLPKRRYSKEDRRDTENKIPKNVGHTQPLQTKSNEIGQKCNNSYNNNLIKNEVQNEQNKLSVAVTSSAIADFSNTTAANPSDEFNSDFYMKDLLKTLSNHLIHIMEAYSYHYNLQPHGYKHSTSIFQSIKQHFFNLSYCAVATLMLPQENNSQFISAFITATEKISNHKFSKAQLLPILLDMLQWAKAKKNVLSKLPSQMESVSNSRHQHDNASRQPMNQYPQPNSNTLSSNIYAPQNNRYAPYSNASTKSKSCIFSNGPPGREISINIDPLLLATTQNQVTHSSNIFDHTNNQKIKSHSDHNTANAHELTRFTNQISQVPVTNNQFQTNPVPNDQEKGLRPQEQALTNNQNNYGARNVVSSFFAHRDAPTLNSSSPTAPKAKSRPAQLKQVRHKKRQPAPQYSLQSQTSLVQSYPQYAPLSQPLPQHAPQAVLYSTVQSSSLSTQQTIPQSQTSVPSPRQYTPQSQTSPPPWLKGYTPQSQTLVHSWSQYASQSSLVQSLPQSVPPTQTSAQLLPQYTPQSQPFPQPSIQSPLSAAASYTAIQSLPQQSQSSLNESLPPQYTPQSQISAQWLPQYSSQSRPLPELSIQSQEYAPEAQTPVQSFPQSQASVEQLLSQYVSKSPSSPPTLLQYLLNDTPRPISQSKPPTVPQSSPQPTVPPPYPTYQGANSNAQLIQDTQPLRSLQNELTEQQNHLESTRSLSTDSGIMSPISFNCPSEISNTSVQEESDLCPVITHVTSLHPKATYITEGRCTVCGSATKQKCLGCLKPYYCSLECQRADWKLHRISCKKT